MLQRLVVFMTHVIFQPDQQLAKMILQYNACLSGYLFVLYICKYEITRDRLAIYTEETKLNTFVDN